MEEHTHQTPPQGGGNAPQGGDRKLFALLSYLGILVVIPLLLKRDDDFVMFHAKQGLVLMIGTFLAVLLMPFFGLGSLLMLFIFILSIMGIIASLQEKKTRLPLVGDIAEKINF